MRTDHMQDRMRQRSVSETEINIIMNFGEWNERTDRLVLTQQTIAQRQQLLRDEIAALERKTQQQVQ